MHFNYSAFSLFRTCLMFVDELFVLLDVNSEDLEQVVFKQSLLASYNFTDNILNTRDDGPCSPSHASDASCSAGTWVWADCPLWTSIFWLILFIGKKKKPGRVKLRSSSAMQLASKRSSLHQAAPSWFRLSLSHVGDIMCFLLTSTHIVLLLLAPEKEVVEVERVVEKIVERVVKQIVKEEVIVEVPVHVPVHVSSGGGPVRHHYDPSRLACNLPRGVCLLDDVSRSYSSLSVCSFFVGFYTTQRRGYRITSNLSSQHVLKNSEPLKDRLAIFSFHSQFSLLGRWKAAWCLMAATTHWQAALCR